jgi:hypothetical protein
MFTDDEVLVRRDGIPDLSLAWFREGVGIGRNNKPAHFVVFWLETFNLAPIYLPTDNLNLIFESLGDILTPRVLRYAFGWDRNRLLRSIMVDLVSETEFVGAFY